MTPRSAKRVTSPPRSDGFVYLKGEWIRPEFADLAGVRIEDGKPLDGMFAERQQRLLGSTPYESWKGPGRGRKFLSLANVGLFISPYKPPLVPDNMLAVDVDVTPIAGGPREKQNLSYFIWLKGKPPDVVVEIISKRQAGEYTHKLRTYAEWKIPYYVIYDPFRRRRRGSVLNVFRLSEGGYEPMDTHWFPEVGLGVTLWTGEYQGWPDTYLRWCDVHSEVLPTGAEQADREQHKRRIAERRANEQQRRAEAAEAKLRALGIDPEE
jgi:hypothetical protein